MSVNKIFINVCYLVYQAAQANHSGQLFFRKRTTLPQQFYNYKIIY